MAMGDIEYKGFSYLIARVSEAVVNPEQDELWKGFVCQLIADNCANELIVLFYGSTEFFPMSIPESQQVYVKTDAGKSYQLFYRDKLTSLMIREHIVDSAQFDLSELLIWKPKARVDDRSIEKILSWWRFLVSQPIGFSEIVVTDECIGYPACDGKYLFWMNPDQDATRGE